MRAGANSASSAEQMRVLDRYYTAFVRNGGGLPEATKARLAEINERLATLGTKFGQNVLADEKDYMLVLAAQDDLAGLPASLVSAAAQTAADRGLPGKHGITLVALEHRAFLAIFGAPRSAGKSVYRLGAARRNRRGDRQSRDCRRNGATAGGARTASRT